MASTIIQQPVGQEEHQGKYRNAKVVQKAIVEKLAYACTRNITYGQLKGL